MVDFKALMDMLNKELALWEWVPESDDIIEQFQTACKGKTLVEIVEFLESSYYGLDLYSIDGYDTDFMMGLLAKHGFA